MLCVPPISSRMPSMKRTLCRRPRTTSTKAYGKVGSSLTRSLHPQVIALTATATRRTSPHIRKSLNIDNVCSRHHAPRQPAPVHQTHRCSARRAMANAASRLNTRCSSRSSASLAWCRHHLLPDREARQAAVQVAQGTRLLPGRQVPRQDEARKRKAAQRAFMRGKKQMVATNARSVSHRQPDVRLVIHAGSSALHGRLHPEVTAPVVMVGSRAAYCSTRKSELRPKTSGILCRGPAAARR